MTSLIIFKQDITKKSADEEKGISLLEREISRKNCLDIPVAMVITNVEKKNPNVKIVHLKKLFI